MLPIRSSAHIRTSRNIRGFRTCRHTTGISMAPVGNACLVREEKGLAVRQMHRMWLAVHCGVRPVPAAPPVWDFPMEVRVRQAATGRCPAVTRFIARMIQPAERVPPAAARPRANASLSLSTLRHRTKGYNT
jgi:hypothetical protein